VGPFKADHDFILCTLGKKGELYQNLPINPKVIKKLGKDGESDVIDGFIYVNRDTGEFDS
jgi:hypothetical protein